MLIAFAAGSGIAPFFPVSNGAGNAPWLFPWRVVCRNLYQSLGHITGSGANMASVSLLPTVAFPDILWIHLVRFGSMDDSWNSPP